MNELEQPIPTEKEIRDLLPGYVLGNLDADEMLTVSDHLPKYPDLHEEVRALENTAMQLAYDAPATSPPLGSKERILGRARVDAEQAQANGTAPAAALRANPALGALVPTGAASGSTPGGVRYGATAPKRLQPPNRSWLGQLVDWWRNALGWKMYALATSVALALLALIFNQTQNDLQRSLVQISEMEAQSSQIEVERATLNADKDRLESELAKQVALSGEALAENDALIVNLKTTLQTIDEANTELRNSVSQLEAANTELITANTQFEESNAQLAASNTQLAQENTQLVESAETLGAENRTLQQTVDTLEGQLGAQDRFWAIFPTIRRVVTLDGTTPQSSASGSLWASVDGAFLLLDGLAQLPDTQTYQLWLITPEEEAIDSGLIAISPDAIGPIAVDLPLGIGDFAAVGISIEPAGGSETPTDVVLLGVRS